MLDNSDTERILPYYFFDYRLSLRARENSLNKDKADEQDNIVIRNGKKYRVTTAEKTDWANKIF